VNTTPRTLPSLIAVVAIALGAAACGSDDDDGGSSDAPASETVTIVDAWVREPAATASVAAGYGTITNNSDSDITLVGASAPFTATYEIHETMMNDDGTMSMQEKENGFVIPADESFVLEPGGPHVMMLQVDPAEFTGDTELTFVFDTGAVTVPAELRNIGADEAMGELEMEDGEMEDGEMNDDG
jgi:copper(I)-binding protein